ncbi:MAG: DUF4249 family protein [Flavobacteriaceae bacterium]|nr:DUF4249 family protein [Flavobacteriaceae bacterium]
MRHLLKNIICVLILAGFSSCEDVIEVDLPTEEPRLIIDAVIRVDASTESTLVTVKVSETNSFFGNVPPANLQQITMSNLDNPGGGLQDQVLDEVEPGIYAKLFPTEQLIADRWFLQVDFEDEFYVAEAKFVPTVPIDNLEFGNEILFDEDDTELIVTFTDEDERIDYYIFDFDFGNFLVTDDEFYQGQEFEFSYFYDEDLAPGDEIEVSILGADEAFFRYMDQIIIQSEGNQGPFETPTLTVRGNLINATDIDNDETENNVDNENNFALGYFAIVQEYKQIAVVPEEN